MFRKLLCALGIHHHIGTGRVEVLYVDGISKSPVKKEAEAKENNPTYDIEAKAYKPKVKEESQIRKQGPGRG